MSIVCYTLQVRRKKIQRQGFSIRIHCYFIDSKDRNVAKELKLTPRKLLGLFLHLSSLLLHMDLLHFSLSINLFPLYLLQVHSQDNCFTLVKCVKCGSNHAMSMT